MGTDDHTEHNEGDYISVPVEDVDQTLAYSIMAEVHADSPFSENRCIFRVPEVLRRKYKEAFEPDVVSIGPFHRKTKNFEFMEKVKKRYLKTLLSPVNNVNVLHLIKEVRESETRARECYQGPINVDDEFLEMMVIDGCFLIELFRRVVHPESRSSDDPIFTMPFMCQNLYHDLLLLENQLPWFILQKLYDLTKPNHQINQSLSDLMLKFFKPYLPIIAGYQSDKSQFEILHVVDLIRNVLVYSFKETDPKCSTNKEYSLQHIPCVTSLLEAGVKFEKDSSNSMMNITFDKGTFKIPQFLFDETTEPMFRNLIAFEQCYRNCGDKITSYAILMDNLIDTSKDVEHLRDVGIIQNWLSAEDASNFFNGLYINTSVYHFCYDKSLQER